MRYLFVLLLLTVFTLHAKTKSIVTINGSFYHELLKRSTKRTARVFIAAPDMIFLTINDGIFKPSITLEKNALEFIKALEKTLEWIDISKKKKIELAKTVPYENGNLFAYANKKGTLVSLSIEIKDSSNEFKKASISLKTKEIIKLIKLLKSIPEAFKELEKESKDDPFK